MFHAIGNFSYRFRWIVIGLWIVLFGVSVAATPLLADVLTAGFANPHAPSQQAAALIQDTFKQGETNLLVVFQSDTLQAASAEFKAAEQRALDALTAARIPGLESIQTYASTGSDLLVSKDGMGSVAVLNFSTPDQTVQKEMQGIRSALAGSELKTYVTGGPAVSQELSDFSFRDLRKVEIYGLPIALIALIFVFGSLVSAALPVVVGGLAVTVTLGGMYLIGHATSMSIFSMNTATLLGARGSHRLRPLHGVSLPRGTAQGGDGQRSGGGDHRPRRALCVLQRAGRDGGRGGPGVLPLARSALAGHRRGARGVLLGGGIGHLPARVAGRARSPRRQAAGHQAARGPRGPAVAALGERASETALGLDHRGRGPHRAPRVAGRHHQDPDERGHHVAALSAVAAGPTDPRPAVRPDGAVSAVGHAELGRRRRHRHAQGGHHLHLWAATGVHARRGLGAQPLHGGRHGRRRLLSGRILAAVPEAAERPRQVRGTGRGHRPGRRPDHHRRTTGAVQATGEVVGGARCRPLQSDPDGRPQFHRSPGPGQDPHQFGGSGRLSSERGRGIRHYLRLLPRVEHLVPLGDRLGCGHEPHRVRGAPAEAWCSRC